MTFVKATNRHVRETSLVKHVVFPSYTHLIYGMQIRVVIGLWLYLQPYPCILPYIKFLCVGSDVCRWLLSDSVSPRTPLSLWLDDSHY